MPGAPVACLGLAFKANIDDFRESPALQGRRARWPRGSASGVRDRRALCRRAARGVRRHRRDADRCRYRDRDVRDHDRAGRPRRVQVGPARGARGQGGATTRAASGPISRPLHRADATELRLGELIAFTAGQPAPPGRRLPAGGVPLAMSLKSDAAQVSRTGAAPTVARRPPSRRANASMRSATSTAAPICSSHLLARIDADDRARGPARTTIVFLGDLVDRGPASAAVIERLRRSRRRRPDTRFLLGNHEEVFLELRRGRTQGAAHVLPDRRARDDHQLRDRRRRLRRGWIMMNLHAAMRGCRAAGSSGVPGGRSSDMERHR